MSPFLPGLVRFLAPSFASLFLFLTAAKAELRINEIMAAGQAVLPDEDGGFPDWLELFNDGSEAVDLGGWHLTDDPTKPMEWTFPARTLGAGEYLVIFASAKNRRPADGPLHTNFRLTSAGEYLALSRPDGSIAHAIRYPIQIPDIAFDGADFLTAATPGAVNAAVLAITRAPEFSQPHGFYEQPIRVVLTSGTPGAEIRYTLDGTEPTATRGTLYAKPIRIAATSVLRAVALGPDAEPSPVVTRTYLFLNDVVQQSPDGSAPPGWPRKWGGAVVDYGMDPRITQRAPYKRTLKDDLRDVPTLSIVMELPHLFDRFDGIYANSFEKGLDWERPMSIELIDPKGGEGFQINAGLRIRGGASRDPGNPKHSLQVRMRSSYGAPTLEYPLFGAEGAQTISRFDLRWDHLAGWHYTGQANATQLPDIFGRDSQLATGSPAKRGSAFHLCINGQYWGVYFTDERVTSDWAASYFGGGDDDYDVVKFDPDANFGTGYADGTPFAWRKLIDFGLRGFRDNADYFRVQGLNPDGQRNPAFERLLDVDNLIDYMLVGIYCAAYDNPPAGGTQNNWYGFKSRKGDFGWRFFVHDFELSMNSVDDDVVNREPAEDPFEFVEPEAANPWHFWEAMRHNPEFRLRVADHIQKLFFNGGVLTPESAAARWQTRMDELDRAIVPESARWGQPVQGGIIWLEKDRPKPPPDGGSKKQFTRRHWLAAATAMLTDYFPVRTGIVFQQLRESNLYPGIEAPIFANGPEGLTLSDPNATGTIYYTLDGSDPRRIGGDLSEEALPYNGPIQTAEPTRVRARVLASNGLPKPGGPIILPPPEWSAAIETTTAPVQDFGGLRITELHYNPPVGPGATGDDSEFIELKNEGPAVLNLGGVTFTEGITFTFPANTTLVPGAFIVLVKNPATFAQLHPNVSIGGVYTGRLSDDGESVALAIARGPALVSVRYDDSAPWPLAADGHGFSLVRADGGDPDDPDNWRASTNRGGSPGGDDPPPPAIPRVMINELLSTYGVADGIELHNSENVSANASGWFLTDDFFAPAKFRIPDGTVIPPHGFVSFTSSALEAANVVLHPEGGEVWLFSADAVGPTGHVHGFEYLSEEFGVSFGRVVTSDGREHFPAMPNRSFGAENPAPLARTLRINEIHFHPLPGGYEFIELANESDVAVSLAGGVLEGLGYAFPPDASVPAHGLAVVTTRDPALFRERHAVPAEVPIYGPALGMLQDNGEAVALILPRSYGTEFVNQVIEALRYNDKRPWPTTAAGFGHSLQRVRDVNYAGEPRNWLAVPPSPGLANPVNAAPDVSLTSPLPLTDVIPPAQVHFAATAFDRDGAIVKVEFLVDDDVVGEDDAAPYEFNWRPTPGLHDLTARATDDTGAVTESDFVTINVDGPGEGTGCGLRGEYFSNTNFTGTPIVREDPTIDFDWFEVPPIEGVPRKGFSVRWTGQVLARRTGEHLFNLNVLGRVRVKVGGAVIIDVTEEPKDGQLFFAQGSAMLTVGEPSEIVVEYSDEDGAAHIELRWSEPGDFADVVIPQTQLFLPGQDSAVLGIASPGQLSPRRVGREFRTQLQAANGRRPYAWTVVNGALPEGVTLSAAGQLAGAAEQPGSFAFIVRVTDADLALAEKIFRIEVLDPSNPELRPVLEITEPARGAEFTGEDVVRVSGTAFGARLLANIEYSINFGPWHLLPPAVGWHFVLTRAKGLVAGDNQLQVRATDIDGRQSRVASRRFKRIVHAPLTVTVEGAGTVTREFLGTTDRIVNESYTIVATPAPGWIFGEWDGAFSPNRRLSFEMTEGLTIKAVFIPNPYPALAGRYTGLLERTSSFPGPFLRAIDAEAPEVPIHLTRGIIGVQLNANGSFTASLRFAGDHYGTVGRFDTSGFFFTQFTERQTGAYLSFSILFSRESGVVSARVAFSNEEYYFESEAPLVRTSFSAAERPCPLAGQFTARFVPTDDALPPGAGFATLRVKPDGLLRWSGRLPDGTAWSRTSWMRDDFAAAFYVPLYERTGSLSGLVSFATQHGVRGIGDLVWSRPDLEVPGFAGDVQMNASPYIPPSAGEPAIDFPGGTLTLAAGDLPAQLNKMVSLNTTNVFVVSPDLGEQLTLRIDPATGLMSGSFLHANGAMIELLGIVDQLDRSGAGYFLGPQTGGALSLERASIIIVDPPVAPVISPTPPPSP